MFTVLRKNHRICVAITARHSSIKKWPIASSKERVGSREDVSSSNQVIKTNVATVVCRRGVSCFILRRVL